jgi:hypothetical protein
MPHLRLHRLCPLERYRLTSNLPSSFTCFLVYTYILVNIGRLITPLFFFLTSDFPRSMNIFSHVLLALFVLHLQRLTSCAGKWNFILDLTFHCHSSFLCWPTRKIFFRTRMPPTPSQARRGSSLLKPSHNIITVVLTKKEKSHLDETSPQLARKPPASILPGNTTSTLEMNFKHKKKRKLTSTRLYEGPEKATREDK